MIALAALGARSQRNVVALSLAVAGVYVLTGVRLAGEPLGIAFAFANAVLFAATSCLPTGWRGTAALDGHRRPRRLDAGRGGRGHADRRLAGRCPALSDPVALLAGIGVGICSSVIPYVSDQLAMRRLPRATYALMVSLLPATATVIGIVVLTQIPSRAS